jgi:hypothetical protein
VAATATRYSDPVRSPKYTWFAFVLSATTGATKPDTRGVGAPPATGIETTTGFSFCRPPKSAT